MYVWNGQVMVSVCGDSKKRHKIACRKKSHSMRIELTTPGLKPLSYGASISKIKK